MKGNKRHGVGVHNYTNGDSYEGEWAKDKRLGRGRILFDDGSKLLGQFIDDCADGTVEF